MKTLTLRNRLQLSILVTFMPVIALVLYSVWEEHTRTEYEAKRQTRLVTVAEANEEQRVICQSCQKMAHLASLRS